MAPKFPATLPIQFTQNAVRPEILPNYSIQQMNNRDKAGKNDSMNKRSKLMAKGQNLRHHTS